MKIVVAVDLAVGSCDWLVGRGARLAERTGGRVDVATVGTDAQRPALDALLAAVPESARGEARILSGDVLDALVGISAAYDALVVGPREPGLFERMLRGHIAARLMSAAKCAVLVPRGPDRDWRSPVHALVGVDVQNPGRPFELAVQWATRLGAVLDISVTDPDVLPWVDDADERKQLGASLDAVRAGSWAKADQLLAALDPAIRGVRRHGEGYPEDVLCDLSSEYDVVLVGNRPRPGLTGTLRGSIGEATVRGARSDVLTLPSRTA